jgi:hypothetical protein
LQDGFAVLQLAFSETMAHKRKRRRGLHIPNRLMALNLPVRSAMTQG